MSKAMSQSLAESAAMETLESARKLAKDPLFTAAAKVITKTGLYTLSGLGTIFIVGFAYLNSEIREGDEKLGIQLVQLMLKSEGADAKMLALDVKFDGLEKKFDGLEKKVDVLIERIK